ncbi:Beta-galactosidase/beta-glucuronidase [Catalinimonas alkaloidigena]|uniref:beta-galactosidase n=1 Tax=Catalinimonas alkaloidigena TaxID=1075417 RepID=A0A1G9R3X5_9BACT|nr:glycoside hydrolase family 2 TIM barrel-domain containing protein [Catalinimonas alkaloidigena]SDM17928.1 Beta-galactosidase/beta-glucuronidase [Catalinimonas alkaloidigena]
MLFALRSLCLVFSATLALLLSCLITPSSFAQTTQRQYLSGTDKDHTVDWRFRVSGGRQAGRWGKIPVPSNWEMQGYGTYHYYKDWEGDDLAPDSVGDYQVRFRVPRDWQGQAIDLVFGGVMTDTEVKINGQAVGPIHQGGFYQFRYPVASFLKYGQNNLLEVRVRKFSTNRSVNKAEREADFWLFGGIFRPVWLEARPPQHLVRTAIDARHTGAFSIDVFLDSITSARRVTAQLQQLDGTPVGEPFSAAIQAGQTEVRLQTQVRNIQPWSAEFPYRYRVLVQLRANDQTLHQITETFGFRTVEVRPHDGVYVNDQKIHLKGVNRHTFWPETGRTTSPALSLQDAQLIKAMNMNAVRMSHYPPDSHFLDVADSLGLYVLDELTGWQAAYDTTVGEKLVRELVIRDVNHPSILFWDNGNEGGFNFDLVDDYAKWDPQRRTLLHPWLNTNGINTAHYEAYDCCPGTFFHGSDLFLPTEFLHGLYDGGLGAGLDDWWQAMWHNPLAVGGFLWAFADEGIVRDDQSGRIDVAGNRAPDGIVGPHREKEGSFYAIREIWSPIYFEQSGQDRLPASFTGALRVENRYDFTNLKQVQFQWQLVDFPSLTDTTAHVAAHGQTTGPDVAPRAWGTLALDLPTDWSQHDALRLTATDPHGQAVYTWTWMIPSPAQLAERFVTPGSGTVYGAQGDGIVGMRTNGLQVQIDATNGTLLHLSRNGQPISFEMGPQLLEGTTTLPKVTWQQDGSDYVVEAQYDQESNLRYLVWRLLPSGWLRLDYTYHYRGGETHPYLGVSFHYPEDQVTGVRWLGRGPYRVWKNRMKGVAFGTWQKAYNDAVTGNVWDYPEFKGFHADLYWATLDTRQAPITMVTTTDDLFLRLFTPTEAEDPRTTHVDFPTGDISFLHGIAPIGTKFHPASDHGPQGQPNGVDRLGRDYHGTVYFYFGEDVPTGRSATGN